MAYRHVSDLGRMSDTGRVSDTGRMSDSGRTVPTCGQSILKNVPALEFMPHSLALCKELWTGTDRAFYYSSFLIRHEQTREKSP